MTQTKTLYDIIHIYIYIIYIYMGVGVDLGVTTYLYISLYDIIYIYILYIYIYMGVGVDLVVTTYAFDDGSAVQECAQEGGVGLGEGRCERAPRGVEEEGRPPQGFE